MSTSQPSAPLPRLVLLHAEQDAPSALQFERFLNVLSRQRLVEIWAPRLIEAVPAAEREAATARQVETSDLVVLLISPDFVEAAEAWFQRVEPRYRGGQIRVIPVLLRPTPLAGPLGSIMALPRGGVAVSRCRDRDETFFDMVREIQMVVTHMKPRTAG